MAEKDGLKPDKKKIEKALKAAADLQKLTAKAAKDAGKALKDYNAIEESSSG